MLFRQKVHPLIVLLQSSNDSAFYDCVIYISTPYSHFFLVPMCLKCFVYVSVLLKFTPPAVYFSTQMFSPVQFRYSRDWNLWNIILHVCVLCRENWSTNSCRNLCTFFFVCVWNGTFPHLPKIRWSVYHRCSVLALIVYFVCENQQIPSSDTTDICEICDQLIN